jgi:hypothetical protein
MSTNENHQRHLITRTWFADTGHEWLQVDKHTLADFGLTPRDFSKYSYTDGHDLYLEGDCDASKFANAVEASGKATLGFNHRYFDDECPVRDMERNTPK